MAKAEPDGLGGYNISYFHPDHLGSAMVITDDNGVVTWQGDYRPFGEPVSSAGTADRYRFTGHELDTATDLTYAKARYYNARLGRFLSVDPAGGSVRSSQSWNRYGYTANNPARLTDPNGSSPTEVVVLAAPAVDAVVGTGATATLIAAANRHNPVPAEYRLSTYLRIALAASSVWAAHNRETLWGLKNPNLEVQPLSRQTQGGNPSDRGDIVEGNIDAPPEVPGRADESPGADWEWRGKPGSQPGSKEGNWHNPGTGESLRPDLDHPAPIGPHWDYRDPGGEWWRIDPDGNMTKK